MKKLLLITITLSLILLTSGCKKTYKNYSVGDKVKIKLNETLIKEFYVIRNYEDKLKLLSVDTIGNSIFNKIQEGYGCQFYGDCKSYNKFEKSTIESNLRDLTKKWINIEEVSLLDIEDLIIMLNLENKYFYKRSNEALEIKKFNDMLSGNYWLVNTYTKSINLTWTINENKIETLSIENELPIKPVITISKDYLN